MWLDSNYDNFACEKLIFKHVLSVQKIRFEKIREIKVKKTV